MWLIFCTSVMYCEKQYVALPDDIEWYSVNPRNKEYRYIVRGIRRDKKLIKLVKRVVSNCKNKSEIERALRKYVVSVKVYTPLPRLICIKVNKPRVAKTFAVSARNSHLEQNIKSVINMIGLCDFDKDIRSQMVGRLMHSAGIYDFKYSENFYEVWPGIYKLYIKVENKGPAKDRILVNQESPLSANTLQSSIPSEEYSDYRNVHARAMKRLNDLGYFEAKVELSKAYNKKHNTIDCKLEIDAGNKYAITKLDCAVDERLPRSVESDIRDIFMHFPSQHPLTDEFGKNLLDEIKKYFKERNICCLQPIEMAFRGQNISSGTVDGTLIFKIKIDDSSEKVMVDVNEKCLSNLIILPAASQDLEIQSGDLVSSSCINSLQADTKSHITLKGDKLQLTFRSDDKWNSSLGLPELNFPEFSWKLSALCFDRSETLIRANLVKVSELLGYDIFPQFTALVDPCAAEIFNKQSDIFSLQHDMKISPKTNVSLELCHNSEAFSNPLGQWLKNDVITGGGILLLPAKALSWAISLGGASGIGQAFLKIIDDSFGSNLVNKWKADATSNNFMINTFSGNIKGTHVVQSYNGINTKLYGNAKIEHKNFKPTDALKTYFCDQQQSGTDKWPNHIAGLIGMEVTRDAPYRPKLRCFGQIGCRAEAIKGCQRDSIIGVTGLCGAKKTWHISNEWLDGEIECDATIGTILGGNRLHRLTAEEISPEHHHQIGHVLDDCNIGGRRGLRLCAGLKTDKFLVQIGIAGAENAIFELFQQANAFCSFGISTRLGKLRFTFNPFRLLMTTSQKNVFKDLTFWEKNCIHGHE